MQSPSNHVLLECLPTAPGGGIAPCPGDSAPSAYTAAIQPAGTPEELAAYGKVNFAQSAEFLAMSFLAVITMWTTHYLVSLVRKAAR